MLRKLWGVVQSATGEVLDYRWADAEVWRVDGDGKRVVDADGDPVMDPIPEADQKEAVLALSVDRRNFDRSDYQAEDADSIASEIATKTYEFSGGVFVESISARKQEKNYQIDRRTRQLISGGFVYDGKRFSLSRNAQINWLGLDARITVETYPLSIVTADDEPYTIANQGEAKALVDAAYAAKRGHQLSGAAKKIEVDRAADIAAVDAVVDDR